MITLQNFKTEIAKVDVSKLDSTLKQGIDYVNDFGDLYNDDAEIKEVIDLFLVRLNAATAKKKDFIKEHIIVAKMPKGEEKETYRFEKRNGNIYRISNKTGEETLQGPAPEFGKLPGGKEDSTCETFNKKGERDISPAAIKKLEACAENLPQTKDAHFVNGAYTPERQKLHKEILGKAKEQKPCIVQRQPVAILTGGPPGSGKSTWLKKYADWVESDKVYHIDADEVRAKLPEYKGWNATSTQKETKDIVNTFIDEIGRPCEFDLVYDGTMNKATSYQPLVDKLKGLGYKIFIIYISVPKEVSQQRVLERYRKMGRYVPKVVIDEVYERGLDAFDKLTKEADGFIRVDGETGKIVDKGGMPLPKKERYTKPGKTAADHDCGCNDKKHEEKCDDCKEGEKNKRETDAEKEKRVVNAEQFIKDVETNPALRTMTEGQIIAIGLDFEKNYRTGSAQKRDEKHDGKKRLSPTPENLIRWMKHPGDFDLIGVDTFERKDATSDYKREISKQKFWNNIFNLKVKV